MCGADFAKPATPERAASSRDQNEGVRRRGGSTNVSEPRSLMFVHHCRTLWREFRSRPPSTTNLDPTSPSSIKSSFEYNIQGGSRSAQRGFTTLAFPLTSNNLLRFACAFSRIQRPQTANRKLHSFSEEPQRSFDAQTLCALATAKSQQVCALVSSAACRTVPCPVPLLLFPHR